MTQTPTAEPDAGRPASVLPPLLLLSAPIIISQCAQMASGVVDVIMAGNLDVLTLGTVATGAALWVPMMIFLLGLLYGVTPTIGKMLGENAPEAVSGVAARGLLVGLLGGALLGALLFWMSTPLFRLVGVAPELIPEASAYLNWMALAMPGMGLFLAFRFVIEAHHVGWIVTVVAVLGVAAKIWLNDALVHGHAGLPALGTGGFGAASVALYWGMAVMLAGATFLHGAVKPLWTHRLSGADLSLAAIGRFLRFGLPIALNFLSDYLIMAVVAVFIATLGAVAIGAHQITFNILMVLLMMPTGLSMAATILISRSPGGGHAATLGPVMSWTLGIGVAFSIALAVLLAAFDAPVIRLYTDDAEVIALALDLLGVVVFILTIDVVAIALGFFLRGLGDPGSPFLILLAAHWLISLPVGYVLCFTDWVVAPQGPLGWWYGLSTGLLVACCLLGLRLRQRLSRAAQPVCSPAEATVAGVAE
ncbi:MATE family efflux transporter [Rhodospirillum rubrum]|uniref:MATE family efflux transporter n=1 Tax=Rhodospirillum rubrum TaxID=1085 RepID=UPI0019060889|nr:MATE family efflux transporter [Rhodospirillum rubrum]MBK1666313.1 MATE family efflux transporter [Rhodospirillum rubrum]MBK1678561.1 MATE family efflux transporter [Rhodospirillum rubrum]